MRSLTSEELKEIQFNEDMIQGNINRMCTTDDLMDFVNMYYYSKKWIDKIFETNLKRFDGKESGKEGHENGTSIRYSIGECEEHEPQQPKVGTRNISATETLDRRRLYECLHECPVCGHLEFTRTDINVCPKCGANIRESEDEE